MTATDRTNHQLPTTYRDIRNELVHMEAEWADARQRAERGEEDVRYSPAEECWIPIARVPAEMEPALLHFHFLFRMKVDEADQGPNLALDAIVWNSTADALELKIARLEADIAEASDALMAMFPERRQDPAIESLLLELGRLRDDKAIVALALKSR